MKIKISALATSIVLGLASVSAMAGPAAEPAFGHSLQLFGLSPLGAFPGAGGLPRGMKMGHHPKGTPSDGSEPRQAQADRAEQPDPARRIARRLRSVDATPGQIGKISAIVRKAHAELMPMQRAMRELDQQASALFVAPALDHAAFASLRAEHLQLLDRISRQAQAAWLDVAAVLTPEQRQKLAKEQARHPFGRGRRGHHGGHRGE